MWKKVASVGYFNFIYFFCSEMSHRCGPNKMSRQQSLQKLTQLQQSIINWEGKDIASNSTEIVCGQYRS
jgi:hypothetical protein